MDGVCPKSCFPIEVDYPKDGDHHREVIIPRDLNHPEERAHRKHRYRLRNRDFSRDFGHHMDGDLTKEGTVLLIVSLLGC